MRLIETLDGKAAFEWHSGFQIKLRDLLLAASLLGCALILCLISLTTGNAAVSYHDLYLFFTSPDQLANDTYYAISGVRLPRIILGFLTGFSIALSGAMLQPITHNPLAEAGLFGISAGSMTVIIIALAFFPLAPNLLVIGAALTGGFLVALLLILFVGRNVSGIIVLLMGIAISSVLSSVDVFLLLYLPNDLSYSIAQWMAGSLFRANVHTIILYIPFTIFALVAIVYFGPKLDCFALEDRQALALGENVQQTRLLAIISAVILNVICVVTVGPVVFLGVFAPQMINFLGRSQGRARLLLSALMGGVLVIAADIISRITFFDHFMLPLGLCFTIIGVPLFLIILRLRASFIKRSS